MTGVTTVREIPATCCYCGVGCGVLIASDGAQILGVRGDPAHPSNRGKLCAKGQQLHLTNTSLIRQQKRLLTPQIRPARDQAWQVSSWEQSLDLLANKIAQCVEQHGRDSVALYLSGQLLTEDYFVFNKLARALLLTNQIDSNSRLCMSSAVAGYKRSLGSDAPPACYDDIEQASLVLIAGANPAYAHPVLYRRLEAARQANPAIRVVVIDPRKTDTAAEADLHLQIQPGTDVALFHGMLHLCFWHGWLKTEWIAAHTTGFEDLRELVKSYTPDYVARLCGIRVDDLVTATRWFAEAPAALSLYCQGLNQSSQGSDKNSALINLHLATAQIGRPGCGPFSLTGQPNAMGGREVGAMANLLPGHRDLHDAADRAELAEFWQAPPLASESGDTAMEMIDGLLEGRIKIIWIVCTNPLQSLPDQARVRAALSKAELVIVQETFRDTASAEFADILLPASSWGEKQGTVTNSERRISLIQAAVPAPGLARPDWWIASQVAQRLQARWQAWQVQFAYSEPEMIWNEHRELTRGRDLDITGLSYAYLQQHGPQHWPFPEAAANAQARLYQDARFAFADGRARFVAAAYRPAQDSLSPRTPIILTTGRLRDQWHGMSRTGLLPSAFNQVSEAYLELHEDDMRARFLRDGDFALVKNGRAQQYWRVKASAGLRPSCAFLAMHWGSEFMGGIGAQQSAVNGLVSAALDPWSRQPELKYSTINLTKHEFAWQALLLFKLKLSDLAATQVAARALFGLVEYAQCLPQSVAGANQQADEVALQIMLAHNSEPAGVVARLLALADLTSPDTLIYQDSSHRQRRLKLHQGRLSAVLQTGAHSLDCWLKALFLANQPITFARAGLFQQLPPRQPVLAVDKRICQCQPVAESQIIGLIQQSANSRPEAVLAAIKQQLGCGAGCGSCQPELKRLIQTHLPLLLASQ